MSIEGYDLLVEEFKFLLEVEKPKTAEEKLIAAAVKNSTKIANLSRTGAKITLINPTPSTGQVIHLATKPEKGYFDSYFLFNRLGFEVGKALARDRKISASQCDSLSHLIGIWEKQDDEIRKINYNQRHLIKEAQGTIESLSQAILPNTNGTIPLTAYDLIYGVSHASEISAMLYLIEGYTAETCGIAPQKRPDQDLLDNTIVNVDDSIGYLGHNLFQVDHANLPSLSKQARIDAIIPLLSMTNDDYINMIQNEFESPYEDDLRLLAAHQRRKFWSAYNVIRGYLSAVIARHN